MDSSIEPSQPRNHSQEELSKEERSEESSDEDSQKENLPPPGTPDRLDPEKVRVIDIEIAPSGTLLRRDCYDPDGGAAEMGDVLRLKDGELYVRRVGWARSGSMNPEVELEWEATGLSPDEVRAIKVYTWPVGPPVRAFVEQ